MPPPRFTVADEPWDPPPNFAIADEPLDPSTLACVRRFIINSQDLILPEQSPKKPTKSLKERLKTSVLQLLVNKDTVLIHWTSLNRAIYGDFKLKVQVWQMFRALCSCFGFSSDFKDSSVHEKQVQDIEKGGKSVEQGEKAASA